MFCLQKQNSDDRTRSNSQIIGNLKRSVLWNGTVKRGEKKEQFTNLLKRVRNENRMDRWCRLVFLSSVVSLRCYTTLLLLKEERWKVVKKESWKVTRFLPRMQVYSFRDLTCDSWENSGFGCSWGRIKVTSFDRQESERAFPVYRFGYIHYIYVHVCT